MLYYMKSMTSKELRQLYLDFFVSKGHAVIPSASLIYQVTAMFSRDLTLARYDADLFAAMEQEAQRQEEHIELIASENYTSPAVMEAQGSVLTKPLTMAITSASRSRCGTWRVSGISASRAVPPPSSAISVGCADEPYSSSMP